MPDPVAPAAAPAAPPPAAAPVKPSPVAVKPTSVQPQNSANGAPPPKPESTLPAKFTRKEKIDGKEVELSATEEELWAAYRKGSTLDRRFEEQARTTKEVAAERARVEQMYARIRDPEQLLALHMEANPEADPVEVLSSILQKRLHEEEQLQDPNIRERRRLERENAEYKTKETQAKEQAAQAEHQRQVDERLGEYAEKFQAALDKTKIPHNDITVKMMAELEFTNRAKGWNMTPEQLARATEKAVHGHFESLLTNETTTDDQLLDAFPALTKRIHRGIVARFKARQNGQPKQPSDITPRQRQATPDDQPKQRTVSSAEEYKEYEKNGGKMLRTI